MISVQTPDYRITRDQAIERERAFGTPMSPDDELLPDEPDEVEQVIRDALSLDGEGLAAAQAATVERVAAALREAGLVREPLEDVAVGPGDTRPKETPRLSARPLPTGGIAVGPGDLREIWADELRDSDGTGWADWAAEDATWD